MSRRVQVACVQLGPPPETSPGALRRRRYEVSAAIAGLGRTDLVVLPELWPAGYFAFDDYARVAEPLDGPTVQALAQVAAERRAHVLAGSVVERDGDALYNTAVLLGPDGDVLASYRKIHVFGYRSRESQLIVGGEHRAVVTTALGRIGLATCYDLRFPELFRALIDDGAELLVVTAAWPAARAEHWRLLLRARALENQAVVVACNAAGRDHGVDLGGHSTVIGPDGTVVAEADAAPMTLEAHVDLDTVARFRAEFPVLADRRLG